MPSHFTSALIVAAAVFNGIMAGANFNRLFIEMPAWRKVGALGWATFSRNADLGTGLVIYPVVAILCIAIFEAEIR